MIKGSENAFINGIKKKLLLMAFLVSETEAVKPNLLTKS